jgi:tRNA (cmo5U34)-methyltransferase
MVELYYNLKRHHGYTEEQIERKRLSLEGALVPVTAAWNEELLKGAGFAQVDCFWRWMNFGAWIAIKD